MNRIEIYDTSGELIITDEVPNHANTQLVLAEFMRERFYFVPLFYSKYEHRRVEYVGIMLDSNNSIIAGPVAALERCGAHVLPYQL